MWGTFFKSNFKLYIAYKWIDWSMFFTCLCILFPSQMIWSYVTALCNIIKLHVVQKSHSSVTLALIFSGNVKLQWQTYITNFLVSLCQLVLILPLLLSYSASVKCSALYFFDLVFLVIVTTVVSSLALGAV